MKPLRIHAKLVIVMIPKIRQNVNCISDNATIFGLAEGRQKQLSVFSLLLLFI